MLKGGSGDDVDTVVDDEHRRGVGVDVTSMDLEVRKLDKDTSERRSDTSSLVGVVHIKQRVG